MPVDNDGGSKFRRQVFRKPQTINALYGTTLDIQAVMSIIMRVAILNGGNVQKKKIGVKFRTIPGGCELSVEIVVVARKIMRVDNKERE